MIGKTKDASVVIAFAVATALTACTTVNRGTTDYLFVDTVPQGARVTIEDVSGAKPVVCPKTPCAIPRPRNSEFIASIALDGYNPVDVFVTHQGQRASLTGSLAGNTAVGVGGSAVGGAATGVIAGEVLTLGVGSSGLAGATAVSALPLGAGVGATMVLIDVTSGATQNLAPNPIVLGLAPAGATQDAVDPRVDLFREQLTLERKRERQCRNDPLSVQTDPCKATSEALRAKQKEIRELTRDMFVRPSKN